MKAEVNKIENKSNSRFDQQNQKLILGVKGIAKLVNQWRDKKIIINISQEKRNNWDMDF